MSLGPSVGAISVRATEAGIDIIVRAASASWAQPKTIIVFKNGYEVARVEIEPTDGPKDILQPFHIDLPHEHDAWISSVILGAKLDAPWWGVKNNYTLAGTNPIWVDRGGTRGYESPRATAGRLIKRAGSSTERLIKAFAAVDDAVLIQAMTLLDEAKADLLRRRMKLLF